MYIQCLIGLAKYTLIVARKPQNGWANSSIQTPGGNSVDVDTNFPSNC